jgi:uncharacterized Tic20 family protein
MGDKYDQLQKLKQLHDDGVLSAEEYQAEKGRLLAQSAVGTESGKLWGMEERVFCMFLHFSQLLGVILPFIPFIGVIVPVVMWASEKDKSRAVDIHGRIVLNWVISYIIYFAISLVLISIVIGVPLLVAVIVLNIVFAIIGGVKANSGIFWKYPLSITFFKLPENEVSNLSSKPPQTKASAGDNDHTSTLSSQTAPSNAELSDTAPSTPRTTNDPLAMETSNLNAVEGKGGKTTSGEAASPQAPEPSSEPESQSDVPEPDSAAPRPKATPEEGTPPGSEDEDGKK